MPIRIVKTKPGPTTTEKVLDLILTHPQGITAKEICSKLNRPISMVQICLKSLKSSRCIYSRISEAKQQLIYYPYTKKE